MAYGAYSLSPTVSFMAAVGVPACVMAGRKMDPDEVRMKLGSGWTLVSQRWAKTPEI